MIYVGFFIFIDVNWNISVVVGLLVEGIVLYNNRVFSIFVFVIDYCFYIINYLIKFIDVFIRGIVRFDIMFKVKGGGIGEENGNIKKREKGCEGYV